MKTKYSKLLLITLVSLVFGAFSTSVLANKVKRLKVTAPAGFEAAPIIKVKSLDGEKWSVIDKTYLSNVSVGLSAKCKYAKRGNTNYKSKFTVLGFEAVGKTEPSNIYIPQSKKASGKFQYLDNGEQSVDLVKVCNDTLADKVANKKNQKVAPEFRKYVFLSEGFKVNYPNAMSAKYTLYCNPKSGGRGDIESRSTKVNAVIDCQASALAEEKLPVEIKKTNFLPLIKNVKFVAKPRLIPNQCKASIDFDGTITSNRKGEVKYQYVSNDGDKSPVFTLNFTKAQSLATNNWHDTVARPDSTNSIAMSGSSNAADISGWWKLNLISPKSNETATAKYAVRCPTKAKIVIPMVKPKLAPKIGN